MWNGSHRARLATVFALALALPGSAAALDILLTNDDGVDAPGIQILRGALLAADHDVTVVAPAENQSGTGGSLDTDVGATVAVTDLGDGRFAVDSTPSDTIRAALGVVLAAPPDLVISGLNFGQNLGQPSSNASGTIGAGLTALYEGLPAIAASVGLDFAEAGESPPFPSTIAALSPAADFIVRLVAALEATARGGRILPERQMLNVNFPVPYGEIRGVRHTRLGRQGDLRFFWVPAGPDLARVLVEPLPGPDPIGNSDANAHRDGFLSISTMDGDMTARIPARIKVVLRTLGLKP